MSDTGYVGQQGNNEVSAEVSGAPGVVAVLHDPVSSKKQRLSDLFTIVRLLRPQRA